MPSVVVHNGDLKQSIDILRKKTQRDGTFKNYKNKERFEEPAQKRKRKAKEAMKRRQKEKQMKTFSNLA
jgi:small subunit ribosomal protein S21